MVAMWVVANSQWSKKGKQTLDNQLNFLYNSESLYKEVYESSTNRYRTNSKR